MAKTAVFCDGRISNVAMLPEMDVTTTNTGGLNMDQAVVRSYLWNICLQDSDFMSRVGSDSKVSRLAGEDLGAGRHDSEFEIVSIVFVDMSLQYIPAHTVPFKSRLDHIPC